jgi:hypothetical protein
VVLALVQAVDAVQGLCDTGTDTLLPRQMLQRVLDDTLIALMA